ncbi:hypothetical protein [Actinoplanes rectilineatus]|uniref:hypothetical protein n=1 Tax=Actinoplanes rectilineatus TaxID=113571 RepID=UPI0012FADD15|nr:hypothetical protein [Actinoplanes rectilineatus]
MVLRVITWLGRHIEQGKISYFRWESQSSRRFKAWPVQTRWLAFVLFPAMFAGCCGGPAMWLAAWFSGATADAGRGAVSPEAAANEYLLSISYNNVEGLAPLLDDDRQDQLLRQRAAYLSEMEATDPAPARMSWEGYDVRPLSQGRVEVRTDVRGNWTSAAEGGGRLRMFNSEAHPWVILLAEDDGWRIVEVRPHPWCGGYVYGDRCSGKTLAE